MRVLNRLKPYFRIKLSILHAYMLRQFLTVLIGCLFAFTSLFLVFDFFERIRTFLKEGSTIFQALAYLLLKIPLIIHLMTPIAVLIATLMAVGRLSQLSEITAMRACGASVFWLAKPLLAAGAVISLLVFIAGETIVPWSSFRVEELYQVDIRKRAETGSFSRENFWYRDDNTFYTVGFYDSKNATLKDVSLLEFNDSFELERRVTADEARWLGGQVGWTMKNAVEVTFARGGRMKLARFPQIPLVITERPKDFYSMQRKPESLSYLGLSEYIDKLASEGVPVTEYKVSLASKLSFPLVNFIAVLIAFPFGMVSARSRKMTSSFIAGISVGFAYHFIHAFASSLGAAELIPVHVAAWTANVLGLCIGGYFLAGAEFKG